MNERSKKMNRTIVIGMCLAVCVICGCATGQGKVKFPYTGEHLEKNEYALARDDLQKQRNNKYSEYNLKNEISYLLDRGLLAHYAGDYTVSNADLLEAERAIEEAQTKSVTQRIRRVSKNDPYKVEYRGEDYENIYLNIFTALNFYQQGNYDSALVEIRKMNNKMKFIEEILEKRLIAVGSSDWRDKVTGKPSYYYKSALAGYLGMLFWRAEGNMDSARIDAQSIADAYTEMPDVYANPLPKELVMRDDTNDELSIPDGMARLNALAFTGLTPLKVGEEGRGTLDVRRSKADRIEIVFDDGKKMSLSLLEPITNVVYQIARTRHFYATAEEKFLRDAGKFKQKAEKTVDTSVNVGLYFFMPLLVTKITTEVIINTIDASIGDYDTQDRTVDRRMGRFLPGRAYAGGINLQPGTYSFTINYYKGRNIIQSRKIENYPVSAGKLNLVQDFCLDYEKVPDQIVTIRPDDTIYAIPQANYPGRLPAPVNFKYTVIDNPVYPGEFINALRSVRDIPYEPEKIGILSWDPVPGAVMYQIHEYRDHYDTYRLRGFREPKTAETWCTVASYMGDKSYKVIAFGNEGWGVPSEAIVPDTLLAKEE